MKIKILAVLLALVLALLCSCTGGKSDVTEHTHVFDDAYSSNGTHHWYECECLEKSGLAEHEWNNGTVTIIPTEASEGIKTYMCVECGHKRSEKLTYEAYQEELNNNGGSTPTPDPDVVLDGMEFLKSTYYEMDEKLPTAPLTLEADIYVDPSLSGRAGAVFSNYMGIKQDWHFEIHENGVPRFYYHDATGNVKDIKFTNVDVRTGNWVHIALTFDYANEAVSVYLDGVLAQSVEITNDLVADITTYKFIVGGDGRSNNSNYFKGQIKSIAAYSDVRAADELAESAANGIDSNADNILVHYELNKDSGNADILDKSPNGYNISKEWLDSHEPDIDYSYSFAVVGDTQWLSLNKPEKMERIYDWIIANKDSKKIAHVFGLGDITEGWNTESKTNEWTKAQQYIYKLNGVIPYSVIRGNHDESKYFNQYFATEEYMNQFGGYFMAEGDVRNSYKTFTVGTTNYLFLTLDFGASDEALEWANNVVLQYPNHRVIVTTHGYQNFDGERLTQTNGPSYVTIGTTGDVDYSVGDNLGRSYNNGEKIWEKFVSKHPNIFLVMCGHTPSEDIVLLQSEGEHGNVVNQMLINPQWMDPQKDGVGMVCMLYFNADGSKMSVEWISTDTGKYYQEQNQFTLNLTSSFSGSAHVFTDSYDEAYHFTACKECGYTYNKDVHTFDGGVLNDEGFMVYSCDCGYKRIASATDDPVALALQAMLEKYYNNGVYYSSVTVGDADAVDKFFNGESYYNANGETLGTTADILSLKDIILGKYGELSLDLGWNVNEGVYASVNEDTLTGFVQFFGYTGTDAVKVTVEEANYHAYIKLLAEDGSVLATAELGLCAKTTLIVSYAEKSEIMFTKTNDEGLCVVTAPAKEGYVAEYDTFILDSKHGNLEKTVHYTTVSVWDGSSVSSSLQGSGTEADPYLIQSAADFAYLQTAGSSGLYFKLTVSIDLNGNSFAIDEFNGNLNGNHSTIRGINVTNSEGNTGLFKVLGESSYVCDLSLYGKVAGQQYTGALAGAMKGTINNVTSYATVSGAGNLGGLVGNSKANSLISNCVNYGSVNGTSWNNGGIVGFAQGEVTDCVNFGAVTTTADCAGGLIGTSQSTLKNSINYGTITAKGRSGGVIYNTNYIVDNCINYGDVISSEYDIGGILGYVAANNSATITNCVNNGNVTGSSGVGGIFGFNETSAGTITITNCVNNGTVTGTWGVGGIAGNTKATVSGCVNNGTLNAAGQLGGIVGRCYGEVTECTNNGSVVGTTDIIGGIVGELHDTTYADAISTTNNQNGTVEGPNCQQFIGKQ